MATPVILDGTKLLKIIYLIFCNCRILWIDKDYQL